MYSHRESDRAKLSAGLKRSSSLKRSVTTLSRSKSSGYKNKTLPRTPSTQVSRLRRRDTTNAGKRAKDNLNSEVVPNGGVPLIYFDGGTQTEFSPPLSPVMLTDSARDLTPADQIERMSLPGSVVLEDERQSVVTPMPNSTFIHPPPGPLRTEVTRSDIKLEEVEENDIDNDYNHQRFADEEVTFAI